MKEYTTAELAAALNCSKRTIQDWQISRKGKSPRLPADHVDEHGNNIFTEAQLEIARAFTDRTKKKNSQGQTLFDTGTPADKTQDTHEEIVGDVVDSDEPAQVAETSSVNSGEKKSPANTDEKFLNNQENNCCANSTTSPPKTQPVTLPAPTRKFDCDGDGFGISTPDKFDETYLFLIERDLDFARLDVNRKKLSRLSFKDLRGLAYETWIHFGCGFIPDWILTKSRAEWQCGTYVNKETGERKKLPPPSDRIIIPTPGMRHFNAIALASDRTRMKKEFWKQHAGEKELFYEKGEVSKAEIVIISEGEVDAMSIWQACIGRRTDRNFAPVAILGAGNWKKTLLPNLSTLLKGKKLLILLDADDTGRNKSEDLRKALIQRGVSAVSKFLFDELSDADKKIFGEKVDANDILIKRGGDFLETLIEKILADAQADFEKAQQEIDSQSLFSPANMPADSTRKKSSHDKKLSPEMQDVLDRVNNSLTRDNVGNLTAKAKARGFVCPRCGNGSGSSGTGADFHDNPPRLVCDREHAVYALEMFAKKNNLSLKGADYYTTLRAAADYFKVKYDPKIFEYKPKSARENILSNVDTSQLADGDATQSEPIDPKVAEWEGINGKADPNLLKQLPEAVKTLEAITPENLTVEVALNSNTHACVALCQVYDWNASLAKKFFVTLDEAKKIAAAQVKSAKDNAGFVAEPTDEVKMLAELDKTEIKAAVKKIVSVITKRQANFAEKHAAKQAAQHRQQAIEEFKASLPTTKKILESCPVDLILPDNISFSANAIGLQFIDGNGNVRTQVAAISPAVVTKVFRENGTDELEYEVAILNRGRWKRKVVSATTLTTAREVGNLASIGLLAEDTKSLAKYFCRLLKANEETIPEITTYTRPGWHDGRFVYPGTTDADYRVRRSNIDYDSIFATHGDAQEWKKKFVEVTSSGGQICLKRIVVGACLAAPLLKVIKIPNFHLHVEGTSSFAKTPLPKLGLSVFGNPTEGGLLRGWNGTAKNRLTMAAGFCDLPQGLDELESLSKKDEESLAKNIYEFSLGIVNQANQRNGDVRPAEHFRSVRVSTGERGLLKDNDKQGAFKRALTLQVEQPLFSDDEARNLHCFLSENFGYFGRQWVEYIAKHQDEIKAHFEGICSYFTKSGFKRELDIVSVDTIDKTNFRDVVACAVAFHHFNLMLEANGAEFDAERAVLDAQEILATLPTVDDFSDLKRSTKLLASWIVENPTRFITPKLSSDNETSDNEPPPSLDELDRNDNPATSFAGTVGKIFPNGDVGFFQNAFRRIIEKDLGLPSYVKFLRDAYTENMLNCPSRREKTRKVTIDGRKISVYIFKASELFPADQAVDDPVAQYYDM